MAVPSNDQRILEAPALVAGLHQAAWLDTAGGTSLLTPAQAKARAKSTAPLVCDLITTAQRLGCDPFPALDVLELFAFVRPARFVTPTSRGLASALGLAEPKGLEAMAQTLADAARRLLDEMAARSGKPDPEAARMAWALARAGRRSHTRKTSAA